MIDPCAESVQEVAGPNLSGGTAARAGEDGAFSTTLRAGWFPVEGAGVWEVDAGKAAHATCSRMPRIHGGQTAFPACITCSDRFPASR